MVARDSSLRATRSYPSTGFLRAGFALLAIALVLLATAGTASAHDYGPCKLTLTPKYDENPLNAPHKFTAYVTIRGGNEHETADHMCARNGGAPAEGKVVTFTVVSGPNAGLIGTSVTGADGKASIVYTSQLTGLDVVEASVSEQSCHTQLDYDDQTLADCPQGQEFTLTVSDTAKKKWYDPNPYYPENPYYCTYGQYYNYGDYCADSVHGEGKKHWVGFKLPKACHKHDFKVKPTYSGGTVLWTKLVVNDTKIKKLSSAPFAFTVKVKKFRKGRKQKLKLTTIFTDGTPVVVSTTFKRCK